MIFFFWKTNPLAFCVFSSLAKLPCPPTRPFRCRNDHVCLRTDQVCNKVDDCGDNSDEEECGEQRIHQYRADIKSALSYFLCENTIKVMVSLLKKSAEVYFYYLITMLPCCICSWSTELQIFSDRKAYDINWGWGRTWQPMTTVSCGLFDEDFYLFTMWPLRRSNVYSRPTSHFACLLVNFWIKEWFFYLIISWPLIWWPPYGLLTPRLGTIVWNSKWVLHPTTYQTLTMLVNISMPSSSLMTCQMGS